MRPILTPDEYVARLARGEIFVRGDWVARTGLRLGQIVERRPGGVTANQWNGATRAVLDYVVAGVADFAPAFAVSIENPESADRDAKRGERMAATVCAAVGLGLLRVESGAPRSGTLGRRLVEYVIDARAYHLAGAGGVGYRDIVGRLPDGRSGAVNDLGAVTRAAAVEAYVSGQVADPIVRGLHVTWADGTAEGWSWLDLRDGLCLFERTRVYRVGFECGVDPARFAEDLATAAIGEWLKTLDDAGPALRKKEEVAAEFARLQGRRAEMPDGFAYDHITFG